MFEVYDLCSFDIQLTNNDRVLLWWKGRGDMIGIAILLVLSSGFLHSIWNLYTKRSRNKNVFLWFCQIVAILNFLPWTIIDLNTSSIHLTGAQFILSSMGYA